MKTLRCFLALSLWLTSALVAQTGLTRLGEFKVNTTTSGDQRSASVASAPDGRFVVAWTDVGNVGDPGDNAVYFQRYNAAGSPIGGETKANTNPCRVPDSPSVAMDANANFIVTWVKADDTSGTGIAGQRFDSNGVPQGLEIPLEVDSYNQEAQDVAMTADGHFAVCWQTYDQNASFFRAYVEFYTPSGSLIGVRTQLNPSGNGDVAPTIAAKPGGGYGVVWTYSPEGSNNNVLLRFFSEDGTPELSGNIFMVDANADGIQENPSVAFAPDGSSVVVFQTRNGDANGYGVFAQRMSATGAKLGGRFLVNTAESGDQADPSVVFDTGTTFVVGYRSVGFDSSGNTFVFQRFNLSDNPTKLDGEFAVNTFPTGSQAPSASEHTITVDGAGNLVFVWTSDGQDGSSGGIYAEKFYQPNQGPPLTEFRVNRDTAGNQTLPSVAANESGQFVVAWTNGSPSDVFAQRYTSDGRRAGDPFQVNPTRGFGDTANRERPTIAMDGSGRFVIAWLQDSGNNGYGDIWVQAFNAAGQAQGGPFIPYGGAQNKQSDPSLAMTTDGAFVIAWCIVEGAAGGNTGSIRAKRYVLQNGQAPLAGSEFLVKDPGAGTDPRVPRVALAPDGRATFSWSNFLNGDRRVFFGIVDSGSTSLLPLAPDRVNDVNDRRQTAPDVVALGDGSFFIGWDDATDLSSPHHPRFRKFSRDGGRITDLADTRVPDQATDDARPPAVSLARDSLGNVLAVWTRSETIGSGLAFRLFNSNGSPTEAADGFDLPVNQTADGDQTLGYPKAVASLGPGKFVVVWQSTVGDGDGTGIYAAVLDLLGVTAPVVTTGEATDKTASTATLNGTVTPNDVAVDVSFELAETEAALGAGSATTVVAVPANFVAGVTTAQAVSKGVTGLTLGIGGTPKTYYYRTKATPQSGGAAIYGATISFTLQNTPPVAQDDTFIILGDDPLDPIKQFTVPGTPGRDFDSDPGQALKIVAVNTPTAAQLGTPTFDPVQGQTITYDKGDFFDGPTGADGDSFSYTIEDPFGAQATATIRVFSVRVVGGLYSGLIGADGGGAASGRLDVMLTRLGTVTGSFKWEGQLYTFKGAPLGMNGSLIVSRPKVDGGGAVLTITLTLDPTTKTLTGKLTDNATDPVTTANAEVTGVASLADVALEDLPEPGIYSAYIDPGTVSGVLPESAPEAGTPVLPRGLGFSQITVKGKATSRSRPARTVGRMPDDQPFSSGARALIKALRDAASGKVKYPLYVDNLYPRLRNANDRFESGGVVSGDLGFTRMGSRFDSDLNWERRPNPDALRFGGGIHGLTAALNAIKYGPPPAGNLPIGIRSDVDPNAKIDLREGDLMGTITQAFKLRRTGTGAVRVQASGANPQSVKLSVNANGGKFSGSFVHPISGEVVKFNGVFKSGDGQGGFTNPVEDGNTGRVQIQKLGD